LAGLCLLAGFGLAVITLAADLVGAGRFGGLGPAQRQALAAAAVVFILGLSLWPGGNRPA